MIPRPALRHMRAAMRQHEKAQALVDGLCDFEGGVCLTRARLKRAAVDLSRVKNKTDVLHRAYVKAVADFNAHHCTPAEPEPIMRETGAPEQGGPSAGTLTMQALDSLIDVACEAHHRCIAAPVRDGQETMDDYVAARVAIRDAIRPLMDTPETRRK